MKKILKKMLVIAMAVIMFVSIAPTERLDAATKSNYLSAFNVSKKTIYKGNGVSISIDNAKKDNNGLSITFLVKNTTLSPGGRRIMSSITTPIRTSPRTVRYRLISRTLW